MEIHELNTFSGTAGAGDYFAMDNGSDTSKISADTLLAPLNARIDNIIAGPASSAEEVIDARQGANGTTYSSLGDAIRQSTMVMRPNITSGADMDSVSLNGTYFKDNNVSVTNGVNSSQARIVVIKGAASSGYGIVQLWFDTVENVMYYRSKRTPSTEWSEWVDLDVSNRRVYEINIKTEQGRVCETVDVGSGYIENGKNRYFSRCEMLYEIGEPLNNDKPFRMELSFVPEQFEKISRFQVLFYTAEGVHNRTYAYYDSELTNPLIVRAPDDAKYFKFQTYSENNVEHIEDIVVVSNKPLAERYNLPIINKEVGQSLAFSYKVSRGAITSGRLLLPPNYSIDGESVPLIVLCHGSGGMTKWDSPIAPSERHLELYQYLANEGFAVFDCYPWTNQKSFTETGTYGTYSPVGIPVNIQSYLKGVEYVCSRYNINGNAVSLLCKSQGGHIGQWAVTQTVYPFKCVALQAPDINVGRTNFMYEPNIRRAILAYEDFDGTAEEKNAFISSGNASDPLVRSFLDKNKGKVVNMIPYIHGITNGSLDTFYNDFIDGATNQLPQWMIDLGITLVEGIYVPIWAYRHEDYVKPATIPSKFWCAYDDTAVSSYGNFAIYHYLQNGGSDTAWRVMPNGTGGHHSMDTDENALKTSGTTALGIAYTDIATAYVEVVDFIRRCMADY